MEHANELLPVYSHQCVGTFLGEHGMDEVQIDTGHKVSFPAIDAVVAWHFPFALVRFRKVIFVAASCDRTIDMRQELSPQLSDLFWCQLCRRLSRRHRLRQVHRVQCFCRTWRLLHCLAPSGNFVLVRF